MQGAAGITATVNFSPVLYTGNGSSQVVTGLDFQPDLVWIKPRSIADNHNLFDSIRGTTKQLISNNTAAESTQPNTLTSFDSNGFSIGSDNNINTNNATHVAWCWKAGGAAVTNTNGTINSQVSANADAGFSIATYTGVGYPNNTTATVGHGLNSPPELVIIKKLNSTNAGLGSWVVGTEYAGSGWDGSMYLNSSGAYYNAINYFWNGDPTSSVVKLKNDWFVNGNNNPYVMYSFHSVDGYQKIGTYTSAYPSTTSVNVGFQPRFVMIKSYNQARNWVIHDSARTDDKQLYPNLSNAEADTGTQLQFTSTGFDISGGSNDLDGGSSYSYIYLAIA